MTTLRRLLAGLALAVVSSLVRADRPVADPPAMWGHLTAQDSSLRGLAFDGQRYYLADCNDYLIDKRPRDNTGRIYIYDLDGRLIKRIPEVPPVRGTFFGHGVATDGARLWTSGYFDPHIYEYDISTGVLLRIIATPASQFVRLDFDDESQALIATRYGDPCVYVIGLDGKVLRTLTTNQPAIVTNAVPDGRGDLWLMTQEPSQEAQVGRIDRAAKVLQTYGNGPYGSIATNIRRRAGGYVQDLPAVFDAAAAAWKAHVQHLRVDTVGGTDTGMQSLAVRCDNVTSGASVDAHFGARSAWNCEDAGLAVQTGDAIRIVITGVVR